MVPGRNGFITGLEGNSVDTGKCQPGHMDKYFRKLPLLYHILPRILSINPLKLN